MLPYKSYAVAALKELIITYLNHPDDWHQALKLMIDLSTAYRWLRRLNDQANRSLVDIRTALLQLKPDYPLTRQLNSKPAALISQRDLLQRFIRLSQQLFQVAIRLIDTKTPVNSEPVCFLNYFLATSTGKALLQA